MVIRNDKCIIDTKDSPYYIGIVPGKDDSIFAEIKIYGPDYQHTVSVRCDDKELLTKVKKESTFAVAMMIKEFNRLIASNILTEGGNVVDLGLCFHLACQAYMDGYCKTPSLNVGEITIPLKNDLFINTEYEKVGTYILTFNSGHDEPKSFRLELLAEFEDEFVEGEVIRKIVECIIALSHTTDYCKSIDISYVKKLVGISFWLTPIESLERN